MRDEVILFVTLRVVSKPNGIASHKRSGRLFQYQTALELPTLGKRQHCPFLCRVFHRNRETSCHVHEAVVFSKHVAEILAQTRVLKEIAETYGALPEPAAYLGHSL